MRLACVGDSCVDLYDDTGKAYPGGNPVNVAVYFTRVGGEASFTGIVGDDGYGKLMTDSIAAKGVDVSTTETRSGKTAISHVRLVNGDRVFGEYEEGVMARFNLSPAQLEYLKGQELVATALWGNAHGYLAEIKRSGARIAYDAATRPESAPALTAMASADFFFFSAHGGDTDALRAQLRAIHERGPSIVVATLGAEGSIAYDGGEFFRCGIVPCEVVDTLGAGDSYIAGFLKGITDGRTIQECMEAGARNSSVTLGYFGAW